MPFPGAVIIYIFEEFRIFGILPEGSVDPEAKTASFASDILSIQPWAAFRWLFGTASEASAGLSYLWLPLGGEGAPGASASLVLGELWRDFRVSLRAAASSVVLDPSIVDRTALRASLAGEEAVEALGIQKSLIASLKAEQALGDWILFAVGRSAYYYDLDGNNTQVLGHYLTGNEDAFPEPTEGFMAAGDLGLSWTSGDLSLKALYSLSSIRYLVPDSGWIRANTDARHAIKGSFSYGPDLGFRVGANFGLNAGRPFTPELVVPNTDPSATTPTMVVSGALNSADDAMLQYRLDLGLSWRFALLGGVAELYVDTVNLLAGLNSAYDGLVNDLRTVLGSDSSRYEDRAYKMNSRWTLLGTSFGFRIRW